MDSSIDKQFTTTPQQQHELGEKELDRLSIISSVEWRQMRLEDKRLYNLDPRPAMQVTNVTSILQPGATPAAEQLIRAWDLHNLRWELVKPSRQGFWTVRQADQDQAKAQGLAMCEVVRFRSLTVSLGSACHVDFQFCINDLFDILYWVMALPSFRASQYNWVDPCEGKMKTQVLIMPSGETTSRECVEVFWKISRTTQDVLRQDVQDLTSNAEATSGRASSSSSSSAGSF